MKNKAIATMVVVFFCISAAAMADDRPRVFQTAEVQPSESPPGSGMFTSAEGAAWLKRTRNRVDGRVMARVDQANAPYSIWWVIFNNPDGCIAECGMADLLADGGAAADVAIFNASGAISAHDGATGGIINADLSVIAGEGPGAGSQDAPCPFPFCQRDLNRKNGLCAEIHVDINEHNFDGDWVQELTYPENPQGFAIFPATDQCRKKKKDDDSDD